MGLSGTWRTTMSGGAGSPGRGPGRRAWRTFRFFTRSFISLTCRASASTARSTAAARSPAVSSLRKVWCLAMRVRAAVRRCFSLESTAFVSMMGSSGSSLESFLVSASLYVLEMVIPRALTMSCITRSILNSPTASSPGAAAGATAGRPAPRGSLGGGLRPPSETSPQESLRRRSRRSNLDHIPCGILRQPPSPLLRLEPPLVRRQDAQLLAVLRDGAPRDGQPLRVQGLGDLLVGQRSAGILGVHHVADHLLH